MTEIFSGAGIERSSQLATARNIDYWGIVTRSARVAWSHKFLWFFGFFAASGGGGSGNYSSVGEHGAERIRDFFLSHIEILVLLIMGVVLLWLVLLVMNVISKGALLSCISRSDRGETIRFEEGWYAGLRHFWGVLGIGLIGLFAFLAVSAICVFAVVIPLIGGAPGIAVALFIGAILFIPYVLFLFLLAFTIIYAEREYVIGDVTVLDALQTGWDMTRSYFWQSLLMWLVSFASAIAFFIAVVVLLLAMSIPFILIGIASPVAGLIMGIPVGIAALILCVSAFSTYDHALWTLLYADLKGPAEALPALETARPRSPAPEAPPAPRSPNEPQVAPPGEGGSEPPPPSEPPLESPTSETPRDGRPRTEGSGDE